MKNRQRISFKLILETLAVIGGAFGMNALKQRFGHADVQAAMLPGDDAVAQYAPHADEPGAATGAQLVAGRDRLAGAATEASPPAGVDRPPQDQPSTLRPGWGRPLPHELPRPTYWPMIVSAGIVFLAWGAVTSGIIAVAGALMFAIGIVGWIGELRHDGSHGEE